ncbi:PREDICTED: uncharacterized protein LOC105562317 [Vollenhovia emeryi]|uniref:uncharacterized protein LOC105562317 n=1 Tax=Vollenhovia emeryi TaxID=411798 RepID=UPI0005F558B1|nr:PREDICTED: uncharacterized protein LOC105562317 [Vollenhovia emeryi]
MVTFQQSLRPLFFMCFIMGLGSLSKNQSNIRWVVHLNVLYSLIIWSAYMYLFFYINVHFAQEILYETLAIKMCEMCNFLISITYVIMSFYHQKRFEINIKKLAAVDDTLEKLGTPKMYEKLYAKSKQLIFGWLVYVLIINFFDTIWWLRFEELASWGLYMAHIINFYVHMNAFVDMLFIFFLWYIGTRFDKVKEHIQCLLMREDDGLTRMISVNALDRYTLCIDYKLTLWTSMHLYLELIRLTRELSLIFTVQMTFEMASCLLYLTSLFYYVYYMLYVIQEQDETYTIYDWFSIIVWVSMFLVRLYIVNYICENVTEKANKINKLFHRFTYIRQNADAWEEIYQFTLQTMHSPLKFTGMGLFYFGYEFLRKFCVANVMYVIIMVQLKIFLY